MNESEDRRKNDEAFKLQIVKQLAEHGAMLKSIETHLGKVDDHLTKHSIGITDINYLLLGGPRKEDIGLMEQFRALAKKWAVAVTILGLILQGLGFIGKEIFKKILNTPIYHSPVKEVKKKPKKVIRVQPPQI